MCDYCRTDGNRGVRCECVLSMEQDNAASLSYRDTFILGADKGGLHAIPEDVLSWAIDRAIQNGVSAQRAGAVFADVYFKVAQRREPRGGYANPVTYLLAAYAKELEDLKK